MVEDAKSLPKADALIEARNRVRVEPVPDWVVPCSYPVDFKPTSTGPITHLLMDRQLHAERRQTHVRMAMRLETMQAVQHQSQWRLEFEPQLQSILLHSVRIRRGEAEFEHASLDSLRFLQREAGLEGFIIDGWVTLLLLVEDVRPGDILEWSYTMEHRPRLLPNACTAWFTVPDGLQLARLNIMVRHSESRPLKWKASAPDLTPVETREAGEVVLTWARENFVTPEADEGSPFWHVAQPWIQVSDCGDWEMVANAVCEAWKEDAVSPALAEQVREITSKETDVLRRIDLAVRLVQDEFRYLSVNLELGGHVPSDAESVIRRRYGDCKDLAFLLVRLLRQMGVQARPILVNTTLRRSLKNMLPSPGLFNHVVAEYEVDGQTRWVDATLKRQGGGALTRSLPDFGLGLPIDHAAVGLIAPPEASLDPGHFELKERILADTAGDWSYLEVTIVAQGGYAENLRFDLESEGLENLAKKRLQHYTEKFSQARRVGPLQYRDEREENRFVLAEVFEIKGFLTTNGDAGSCWLQLQNVASTGHLPVPVDIARRAPLALPYPCRIVHTIEIESLGLNPATVPASKVQNEFFEFTSTSRGMRKSFTVTFSFSTLTDAVAPGRLAAYKKDVEQALSLSTLRLNLPVGYSRMRKRDEFGALPPPVPRGADKRNLSGTNPIRRVAPPNLEREETPQTATARAEMEKNLVIGPRVKSGSRRHHSHRSSKKRTPGSGQPKNSEWMWILGAAGVLILMVLLLALFIRLSK